MDKLFMFDVDGTLTPSRQPMTKKFQDFFKKWIKNNKFYLVTGSDLPKLQEQMDYMDIEAEGIFTCCGNEFWRPDPHIVNSSAELIYENKFELPPHLEMFLKIILENTRYPFKFGNHIEDRGSMVNFSIVGRNCNLEQRKHYFEYDNEYKEREKIVNIIKSNAKGVDAVIGGQISIDIYPEGKDKSQIFDIIKQDRLVKPDEYIFIGDRTMKGGNDYPLAKLMEKTDNCRYFKTEGPEQTMEILQLLEVDGEYKLS